MYVFASVKFGHHSSPSLSTVKNINRPDFCCCFFYKCSHNFFLYSYQKLQIQFQLHGPTTVLVTMVTKRRDVNETLMLLLLVRVLILFIFATLSMMCFLLLFFFVFFLMVFFGLYDKLVVLTKKIRQTSFVFLCEISQSLAGYKHFCSPLWIQLNSADHRLSDQTWPGFCAFLFPSLSCLWNVYCFSFHFCSLNFRFVWFWHNQMITHMWHDCFLIGKKKMFFFLTHYTIGIS